MYDFLQELHPVALALLAGLFTWGLTALGAATVFMAKQLNRKFLDSMLGFAIGVMLAVSFWSLLAPAIEMSTGKNIPAWFPAAAGFLLGTIFLRGLDRILPHLHLGFQAKEAEGFKTKWRRSTLLILAVTLHNIPEGLTIGVTFGGTATETPSIDLFSAIALAIGIGIHNFPEGMIISILLRQGGMSRAKSFWYGQLSAIAEPIASIIGAGAVFFSQFILPYAMAFAAGAMIFVVVEELIPESQRGGNSDLATISAMIGFTLMMILDVAVG